MLLENNFDAEFSGTELYFHQSDSMLLGVRISYTILLHLRHPIMKRGLAQVFNLNQGSFLKDTRALRHHFHEGFPHLVFCFVLRSQSESISEMIDVELTGCQ